MAHNNVVFGFVLLSIVTLLSTQLGLVRGYGFYVDTMPNGRRVPCPSGYCTGTCEGFAHVNADGTPGCSGGSHPLHSLNDFGNDWSRYGLTWSYDMCITDSDGDGWTNGDELGDPCCVWSTGATPQRPFPVMHPGHPDTTSAVVSCKSNGVPTFNISVVTISSSVAVFEWFSPTSSCMCSLSFKSNAGSMSQALNPTTKTLTAQAVNLTALSPDTEYNINVEAMNMAGGTPVSLQFRTLPVNTNAPAKPTVLPILASSTPLSLEISWEDMAGTSSDPSFSWHLEAAPADGGMFSVWYKGRQTKYTMSQLKANTTYIVRIRGSNANGDGYPGDSVLFTTATTDATNPFGYVNADGTFRVYWSISGDEITFDVMGATAGWVGLGLGSTPTMLYSDMFMGGFDGGTGVGYLDDRWSTDRVTPIIDSHQDLTLISASETDSTTMIVFKRKLDTGDTRQDTPIKDADMYLMWAYGGVDSLSSTNLPNHVQRGALMVNLVSGRTSAVDTDAILDTHAALQFISWMIFIPIGAIIARYYRVTMGVWWFRLHVALQVLGFVLSTIGFILGFVGIAYTRTPHFANAHSYFGLFLYLFLLIQTWMGVYSHLKYDPKRSKAPVWPDVVHRWFGVGTMVLAFLTVILGFYYHHVETGTWFLGTLVLGYILIAVMVFEFF